MQVAKVYHGHCEQGKTIEGTIGDETLRRIQEILNKNEHGTNGVERLHPNWKEELEYVKKGGGEPIPVSVTCDIFIDSKRTNKKYAFELKGPLPNSDQTKVSKEKMFKLLSMNKQCVDFAYYALVYNPYGGKRGDYSWTFPKRWFDIVKDEVILIGEEYWNKIGGDGTYKVFIDETNKLGASYKERIYREFLGIDPPYGFDEKTLK